MFGLFGKSRKIRNSDDVTWLRNLALEHGKYAPSVIDRLVELANLQSVEAIYDLATNAKMYKDNHAFAAVKGLVAITQNGSLYDYKDNINAKISILVNAIPSIDADAAFDFFTDMANEDRNVAKINFAIKNVRRISNNSSGNRAVLKELDFLRGIEEKGYRANSIAEIRAKSYEGIVDEYPGHYDVVKPSIIKFKNDFNYLINQTLGNIGYHAAYNGHDKLAIQVINDIANSPCEHNVNYEITRIALTAPDNDDLSLHAVNVLKDKFKNAKNEHDKVTAILSLAKIGTNSGGELKDDIWQYIVNSGVASDQFHDRNYVGDIQSVMARFGKSIVTGLTHNFNDQASAGDADIGGKLHGMFSQASGKGLLSTTHAVPLALAASNYSDAMKKFVEMQCEINNV